MCAETQSTNQRPVGDWPGSFWIAYGQDRLAAATGWILTMITLTTNVLARIYFASGRTGGVYASYRAYRNAMPPASVAAGAHCTPAERGAVGGAFCEVAWAAPHWAETPIHIGRKHLYTLGGNAYTK